MSPSSNLPKFCSNNQCRKVMDVPREGWKCENNRVAYLCNGCYVSFNVGEFCELYHNTLGGWKKCTSCKKPIHCDCIVSQSLYEVSKEPSGIKCLDCSPQDEIVMKKSISSLGTFLRSNIEGISGDSTVKTATPATNNIPQIEAPAPSVDTLIAPGHVSSPQAGERIDEAKRLVAGSRKISAPQMAKDQGTNQKKVSEKGGNQIQRSTPSSLVLESSTKAKARTRKHRSEHRYVPRFTDQELKQMSRGSKVQATPLFEKVLTVSDTGKIGRLVLPKKCAEAHFPRIDIPEGKHLTFQDLEGTDWEFTFRYWPNNNSRMYVLEKFDIYANSNKLKAGDTVMFSRLESKRKLVIGHRNGTSASSSSHVGLFRKLKTASPPQRKAKMILSTGGTINDVSKGKTSSAMVSKVSQEKQKNPISVHSDVVGPNVSILANRKRSEMDTVMETTTNGDLNKKTTSAIIPSMVIHEDPNVGLKSSMRSKRKSTGEMGKLTGNTSKKVSKIMVVLGLPCVVSQEKPNDATNVNHSNAVTQKIPLHHKRKQREFGLSSKSTTDENKMVDLSLDFQGGQELIRRNPCGTPPSMMVLEGVKLISYKDDPVIGRPSMFTKHDMTSMQWAQCAKCCKWRKVPVEVELSENWTCRENHWDLQRLRCSAKEELTQDMIKNIFSVNNQCMKGSSKKRKTINMEPEQVETIQGQDAVAVTMKENKVALAQPPNVNKKHPRHKPGCTCVVCKQSPSGSKHKPSCKCYRCTTTRRRRFGNPVRGRKLSKKAIRKKKNTKNCKSKPKTQKSPTEHEKVAKLPEIGTSNLSHQMVANGRTEVDTNTKNSLDSDVAMLTFDLNLPAPEYNEDDMDIVDAVPENPHSVGNI